MPPTPARVLALFLAAAAVLAGCGGAADTGGGDVSITVTRDFGRTSVVVAQRVPVPEPPALAGILGGYGQTANAGSLFVNGIKADKPAAELEVDGGDRVWRDEHDTGGPRDIPAVVGSFPEPFVHGIGGKRLPVRVECDDPRSGPCAAVAGALVKLGVVAGRSIISRSAADETLRILVGPWNRLRGRDFEADSIDQGPADSGVFARFDAAGDRLVVFDAAGRPARTLGAGTGLVAATAAAERQPVWFVTGTDDAGVAAAARALDESVLSDRFALAISRDLPVAVPQP